VASSQERDEGRGQGRLGVGGTDHLLPDDRVGAVTRRPALGPLGGSADRCVDRVQRDRSDDIDSLLPQRTDHSVGGLPRQVGENEIAWRLDRATGQDREVRDTHVILKQVDTP